MGRKGKRAFRNNYKGHMDKTKEGWNQGREVGMAGVGEVAGGLMQTTVLEQQQNNFKKYIRMQITYMPPLNFFNIVYKIIWN